MRGVRRTQGFSLIEVIVALTLLAVVINLLFNLFPTSILGLRQAEHQIAADSLARSLIETQRAQPFSQMVPLPPTDMDPVPGPGGVVFQPTLEILDVGTSGNTREVRVVVSWQVQNKSREVTHAVYVSKIRR